MNRLIGFCLIIVGFVSPASGQKISELKATATPGSGPTPLRVSFAAEGIPRAETPDWEEYSWFFGSKISRGATTEYTFEKPGKYDVTVVCNRRVNLKPAYYMQLTQSLTITVVAPPRLQVTPTTLDFQVLEGDGDPSPGSLLVSNSGGGTLDWRVSNDSEKWLRLTESKGALSNGQSTKVSVQPIAAGLAAGVYPAVLTFAGGNPTAVVTVNVKLTVASRSSGSGAVVVTPNTVHRFPWWLIAVVTIVLCGAGTLALKASRREHKTKAQDSPRITLSLGPANPTVSSNGSLLAPFLRVRVNMKRGVEHVPTQRKLVGGITKL